MSKSTNTVISTPLLKIMHNLFHHPEYKVGPSLVNRLLKFINDTDPNDCKILYEFDSLCLFGTCVDNGGVENDTTLSYKEHSPVILNTSKYHTVINFSENRYPMSIGILKTTTF